MARSAGGVVVSFDAGTATFFKDVELADGKIQQFGKNATSAMTGTRSSMVAASTAIRGLEGNIGGATRAVARFLSDTAGLGPLLTAAFPIIGAVALIGVIGKISEGITKFIEDIQNAQEKVTGAFNAMIVPIRTSNDERQLANDRLLNDIAKLEGHRQNTLAILLDEAKLSADRLGESLQGDIQKLDEFLKKNESTGFSGLFKSSADGNDNVSVTLRKLFGGETGAGGFTAELNKKNSEGQSQIESARAKGDLKGADAARAELNENLKNFLYDILAHVNNVVVLATERVPKPGALPMNIGLGGVGPGQTVPVYRDSDFVTRSTLTAADNELIASIRETVNAMILRTGLSGTNAQLTQRKSLDEIAHANAEIDRPYDDKIRALQAQLSGTQGKTAAIGGTESTQLIAQAQAEYLKLSAEIAKVREKNNIALNQEKENKLALLVADNALADADEKWLQKLTRSEAQSQARISSLQALTQAIGGNYEATKKASVQAQLDQEFASQYASGFMSDEEQLELSQRRRELEGVFDAEHQKSLSETTEKIQEQVSMENALAAAQKNGLEAVRQAQLAEEILQVQRKGGADTEAQVQAMYDRYNAERRRATGEQVGKIEDQTEILKAQTAAILQGAEAQRKAGLEAKYAQMEKDRPGSSGTEREKDTAAYQQEQLTLATKTGREYVEQVRQKTKELDLLRSLPPESQKLLSVQISLRDVQNELLEARAKEILQLGTLGSGVRAFFLEMQKSALTSGQIIYSALHSAFEKVTDEFSKLVTGQKTNFGKMFQELGQGLVKSTVQSAAQRALGALGKHLGIAAKADGQSESTAWWVKIANAQGVLGGGGKDSLGGILGGIASAGGASAGGASAGGVAQAGLGAAGGVAQAAGGTGSAIAKSAGGILAAILGAFIHRADGGDVSAGRGYIVGERGPEPFFPQTSGSVMSNSLARKTFGGSGSTYHVAIDARGTDPALTEQRVFKAIQLAHQSAIGSSVQASVLRSQRVPPGR